MLPAYAAYHDILQRHALIITKIKMVFLRYRRLKAKSTEVEKHCFLEKQLLSNSTVLCHPASDTLRFLCLSVACTSASKRA
jgi:hypothetical protein